MIAALLSALPLWLLLPAAHAKPEPEAAPAPEAKGPTKTSSTTEDGLLRVTVDLNNDGKVEIINYYKQTGGDSRLLMRKEVDLNSDGHVDMRSSFNEAGQLTVEEMDGDFDGRSIYCSCRIWVRYYS